MRLRKGQVRPLGKSLAQHKHCIVCRKVCSVKKDTCSDECEAEWNENLRKRRRMQFVLWGVIAVFIAILLVATFGQ